MKKMSLSGLKSLSRNEMKKIMAGSGGGNQCGGCYVNNTHYGCYNDTGKNDTTCKCNDGGGCS